MSYKIFEYQCQICGYVHDEMMKDPGDQEHVQCPECQIFSLHKRLPPATRTTFRFADDRKYR